MCLLEMGSPSLQKRPYSGLRGQTNRRFPKYASFFTALFDRHNPTFRIQHNEMWRYHPITHKEEYGMIYVWKFATPIAPMTGDGGVLTRFAEIEKFSPMNFPVVDWENPLHPPLDLDPYIKSCSPFARRTLTPRLTPRHRAKLKYPINRTRSRIKTLPIR